MGITMKVLARIDASSLVTLADEVTGVRFQIVAPEFSCFDYSAVYCESAEDVLELLRQLKAWRLRANAGATGMADARPSGSKGGDGGDRVQRSS